VRRHADGTLPAVLEALRQVLRDYDPKTLEKLEAELRPPAARDGTHTYARLIPRHSASYRESFAISD